MSTRAMQAQRMAIEVSGHNMANVNNAAYARQRVAFQTSDSIATRWGLQGTGVDASRISQIRNVLLDEQIVAEASVTGSMTAQQRALQYAQSNLGQQIDRSASGAEGSAAALGTGAQHGLGESISELFNAFQSLSTQPSSLTERDIVLTRAAQLAERFQQTDSRLSGLHTDLNRTVASDIEQVNNLLADIAKLNEQVGSAEMLGDATANDIRDTRQAKLEELAQFVSFDVADGNNGSVNITIGGALVVENYNVADRLEAYDANGSTMVRAASTQEPLTITGGSVHGSIGARDGAIATLRSELNDFAATLISQVNAIHQPGYGRNGTTGALFFEGTGAADIRVNQALVEDPTLLQASGVEGEVGNNDVAVAIAQLANNPVAALRNQTFGQRYSQIVAGVGEALHSVNEQVIDQSVVETMLKRQRDSISGVSIDEEMTDLIKFQKAFEASARLVNIVDEMLDTVLNMKR